MNTFLILVTYKTRPGVREEFLKNPMYLLQRYEKYSFNT